jgi:hypothetical protein
MLINFTWWINRQDPDGTNLFEGGFLGLDNIGPIDRSHLPAGYVLEQSDSTGWMGFYTLSMLAIGVLLLRQAGRPTADLALKFMEHLSLISDALQTQDLWDEEDGLFYDRLRSSDGTSQAVRVRSVVSVLPMLAVALADAKAVETAKTVNKRSASFADRRQAELQRLEEEGVLPAGAGGGMLLLGVVGLERVFRLLTKLFDENEFLSPYGLRAVSRYHADHPFAIDVAGYVSTIDYEPAESTTAMFGGNSNWRGPIWMPINYLAVAALARYGRFLGDDVTVEYPTGSGKRLTLSGVAHDLRERLISLFLVGPDGRRPCHGWVERLQTDPAWKDNITFNEYFHGDNGAGLGATHQTGWTGIVADLIIRSAGGRVLTTGELIQIGMQESRP